MLERVRAEDYKPKVRYMGNLVLLFKTKEAIYIHDKKTKSTIIVNRWFDRGKSRYAKHWLPLRNRLMYGDKDLSIYDIVKLARHYDLNVCYSHYAFPEITEDIIVVGEEK